MVGASGMVARVYDDSLDTSDPSMTHRFNDVGVDAQYQYLLDPHAVTAQFAFMRNRIRYSGTVPAEFVGPAGEALPDSNAVDTNHVLRAKLTYVYQAKYGGSVGFFNLSGSTNTLNQTAGFDTEGSLVSTGPVSDNLSGHPATRGMTYEAFWTPIQYLRLGAQYTAYNRYNGASRNYNGVGRNASDNNSMFLYAWFAY